MEWPAGNGSHAPARSTGPWMVSFTKKRDSRHEGVKGKSTAELGVCWGHEEPGGTMSSIASSAFRRKFWPGDTLGRNGCLSHRL